MMPMTFLLRAHSAYRAAVGMVKLKTEEYLHDLHEVLDIVLAQGRLRVI